MIIKKRIDYNFHIFNRNRFTKRVDRKNLLYGIISTKAEESQLYFLFREKNFLYTIDKDFNVIDEKLFSEEAGLDLIYQKDGKLIFYNRDSDYHYFETLYRKKIKIEDKQGNYFYRIIDDILYVYDSNIPSSISVDCYSTDLELIERKIIPDKRFFMDKEFISDEMLYSLFKNESVVSFIHQDDMYYVKTGIFSERKHFIHILNEKFNSIFDKEIILQEVIFGYMEVSNNNIYLAFFKDHSSIKYVLYKYDLESNKEETEEINAYGVSFMRVNNKLCLAIEDPKRYTKEQRSLRKQILCGNSSLLVLE